MIKLKVIMLAIVILCSIKDSIAQFKLEPSDISVLLSDTQMGVPFVRLFPIHPGLELSSSFLKKEKTKSTQRFSGHLGYIHHNILFLAPYLKATYEYEYKIKNTIGFDSYIGVGYLHAFYPGEGYRFNEATNTYESSNLNQAFFLSNVGFGLSYIKPSKIQPFLKYNINFIGFALDFRYLISSLHLGVRIDLQNELK